MEVGINQETGIEIGDRSAPTWPFTINQPPFAFPEATDRWAPVEKFTMSEPPICSPKWK